MVFADDTEVVMELIFVIKLGLVITIWSNVSRHISKIVQEKLFVRTLKVVFYADFWVITDLWQNECLFLKFPDLPDLQFPDQNVT